MSPAEIERELHESNGIESNTLALQLRILVTRNTPDNINHGPIITFRNETDAEHYKTYGILFRGDHCYARDYIETKRRTGALTATNSHT